MGLRFDDRPIRSKLLLVLVLCIALLAVASVGVQRIAIGYHSDLLYRGSADLLHLASRILERELTIAREVSFRLATDVDLQQALAAAVDADDPLSRRRYADEIRGILRGYSYEQPYITNVHLLSDDADWNSYRPPSPRVVARLAKIRELNTWAAGQPHVVTIPGETGIIRVVRPVRELRELSLDPLAGLIVEIDLEEIARRYGTVPGADDRILIVFHEGRRIYSTSPGSRLDASDLEHRGARELRTVSLGGEAYLAASTSSADFTFAHLVPRASLTANSSLVGLVLLLSLLAVAALALALGVRLTRGIAEPLELLTEELRRMEAGDFTEGELTLRHYTAGDEIGHFYREVRLMLARIRSLVRENYEKQLRLRDLHLRSLRSQINPHFLYNTLDSINWLARSRKQRDIADIATSLARLLRTAVELDPASVSLSDELRLLDDYLSIQATRFPDAIRCTKAVDPAALACRVPVMSLQPIVENSIRYSLLDSDDTVSIVVEAAVSDGTLVISIRDDGPGIDSTLLSRIRAGEIEPRDHGIGLSNIAERITLLFGPSYGLDVESTKGAGTLVRLRLPVEHGDEHRNV